MSHETDIVSQLQGLVGEVMSQRISVFLKLVLAWEKQEGDRDMKPTSGNWCPHCWGIQLQVIPSGFCPVLPTLWRDRELNNTWQHSPHSPRATATDLLFKCWFLQNAQACLRGWEVSTLLGLSWAATSAKNSFSFSALHPARCQLCCEGRAIGGPCTQSGISSSAKPKLCLLIQAVCSLCFAPS